MNITANLFVKSNNGKFIYTTDPVSVSINQGHRPLMVELFDRDGYLACSVRAVQCILNQSGRRQRFKVANVNPSSSHVVVKKTTRFRQFVFNCYYYYYYVLKCTGQPLLPIACGHLTPVLQLVANCTIIYLFMRQLTLPYSNIYSRDELRLSFLLHLIT